MADVGLDADLSFDISAALSEVDKLESALESASLITLTADTSQLTTATESAVDQADTDVLVTGDASEVTGATTAAVDAADTDVLVTGDASELTGDTTAAIDAADTDVLVTGDASEITGAVTSAVDAADTHVTLTADAGSIRSASSSVDDLEGSLGEATVQAGVLRGALALLGTAAAIEGFRRLVDAASELEQAVGGTDAIFGEAAGDVSRFAQQAADAAGLTETAARNLTSQLGGLLQGFGFTQQEAAALSIQLAQLGADLAATFGGSSTEAVEALGAALRGEFDPLERFGISLNVTQANLKAVELGLADSTSEVDLNARAQASLALIMEQSANAQGQFAREANTTAGQMERATAEAGNAAAAVGKTLQPAMNDLIATFRADTIPALQELGEQLGPSLVEGIQAMLPLLGASTNVLISLTPVVDAAAAALSSIPEPVLQAVAAFALFQRIRIGSLIVSAAQAMAGFVTQARTATTSAAGFRTAMSGLASTISPAAIATVGLTAAFVAYSAHQQRAAERAAETEARITTLSDAVSEADNTTEGLSEGWKTLAADGDDVAATVTKLGFSASQLVDLFLSSRTEADALNTVMQATDDFSLKLAVDVVALGAAMQGQARATIEAAVATGDLTREEADRILSSRNVVAAVAAYTDTQRAADEQTRQSIEAALRKAEADGLITQEQAEAVRSAEDMKVAFDELQTSLDETATAIDVANEVTSRYTDATGRTAEQNRAWASELQVLGRLLGSTGTSTATVEGRLLGFALAANSAEISSEDLEAVAASLGVTAGDLEHFIGEAAAAVQRFGDAATEGLLTAADVGAELDDSFSLRKFRSELEDAITANEKFVSNLEFLIDEGFPRLAQAAAELGPQATQRIAKDIRKGGEEVGAETELLLERMETQVGVDLPGRLTEAGVQVALSTGAIGSLASEAFGNTFDVDAKASQETQRAVTSVGDFKDLAIGAGRQVGRGAVDGMAGSLLGMRPAAAREAEAAVAALIARREAAASAGRGVGGAATLGLGAGLAPMPGRAGSATGNAVGAVRARSGSALAAGSGVGAAVTSGFGSRMGEMRGRASSGVGAAIGAVNSAANRSSARSGGSGIGVAIGDGLVSGIGGRAGAVASAARRLAQGAIGAAIGALGIGSPSRVFQGLGHDIGDGLAIGIAERESDVVAEAESIARAAADAAQVGLDVPVTVDPAVTRSLGGDGMAGTVINVEPGAVVVQLPPGSTPAQAEQLASAAGRGFLSTIAQRQVVVTARTT